MVSGVTARGGGGQQSAPQTILTGKFLLIWGGGAAECSPDTCREIPADIGKTKARGKKKKKNGEEKKENRKREGGKLKREKGRK